MIPIHASVILALHSENDTMRAKAKAFVVKNRGALVLDFYNIGACDHVIWEYFKDDALQAAYWPFLDLLQTRHIQRAPTCTNLLTFQAIEPASPMDFEDDLELLYSTSLNLLIPNHLLEQSVQW